jgi:regulatory protein
MPTITRIAEQKRRPNRRSIHIDGRFAFGCNVNVVARFRLREGMELSAEQIEGIQRGEVRQECFDKAIFYLQRRLHSRAELVKKLAKLEYPAPMIDEVLADLERLGYVNDQRFAATRAQLAADHRSHGPRRAMLELLKTGVSRETASRAIEDVYETRDNLAVARRLAEKKAPSLKRLDPQTARRRLAGMLLRRGFDYDTVKPVIDEVLGSSQTDD